MKNYVTALISDLVEESLLDSIRSEEETEQIFETIATMSREKNYLL